MTGSEYVGYSGSGTFTQTGGTHTLTADLKLGANAGGDGTYALSGGALDVGGDLLLANDGAAIGSFLHSGGTANVNGIVSVGEFGDASYTLDGAAQLTAGRVRSLIEGAYQLRSKEAFLKSEEDFKIDGEKIHLG